MKSEEMNPQNKYDEYIKDMKWFRRYPMYMEDLDRTISMYMTAVETNSIAGLIRSLLSDVWTLETELKRREVRNEVST